MSKGGSWSKFHWDDYECDLDLKVVSLAAQGLWMRLLCLMHRSEPYGHLVVHGRRPSIDKIGMLVSRKPEEIVPLMAELEAAHVFSRTVEGGVIFSRRMVADRAAYEAGRANGLTGGNPSPDAQPRKRGRPPGSRTKRPIMAENTPENTPENTEINGKSFPGITEQDQRLLGGGRTETESETELELKRKIPPTEEEMPGGKSDLLVTAEVHTLPSSQILEDAMDAWNVIAARCRLSPIQLRTDPRRRALRQRLADCGGLPGWLEVLDRVARTPFLIGDNDKLWRLDFDTLIQRKTFTKVVEGGFDRAAARPAKAGRMDWLNPEVDPLFQADAPSPDPADDPFTINACAEAPR